jgi:glycosyltransferase involved in cell wall biosynthesis
MQQLAHTLGLDDVVEFTGLVSTAEVVRALASADVCLSPEPSNPLNDVSTMIKVGEYMAMARPIIAFDLAETRAIAADAAIYAPPNDVEAFADAIDSLLDDPDRRRTFGVVGRRRAEEMLAWHHSAANLRRAYERILPEGLDAAERAEDSTVAPDRIHA